MSLENIESLYQDPKEILKIFLDNLTLEELSNGLILNALAEKAKEFFENTEQFNKYLNLYLEKRNAN